MKRIELSVYGDPKGQPRPKAFSRGGHAAVYDPGTAEGWKSLIAMAAKPFLPESPLTCALRVDVEFIFRRPMHHFGTKSGELYLKADSPTWHTRKPDRDNLDKAVLDALTQLGIWNDDALAVCGLISKRYARMGERPGAHIVIEGVTCN